MYSLGLLISDVDVYLLARGIYTLRVYSLGPPIFDLELHIPVLQKKIYIKNRSNQACLGKFVIPLNSEDSRSNGGVEGSSIPFLKDR